MVDLVTSEDRIVVLATRSGAERHATRFGDYFAIALGDPSADIDKNQRISVEEAFDFAERQVSDYFERNDQLATEHARLEGQRAERMALARLGGAQPNVVDTALGELIADRDALNAEIDTLRLGRDDMPRTDYQSALLERMLELARVEDAIEARQEELDANE
jgi:cell division protein FtsB